MISLRSNSLHGGELDRNVLTVNIVGWLRIPLGVVLNVGADQVTEETTCVQGNGNSSGLSLVRIVLILHVRPEGRMIVKSKPQRSDMLTRRDGVHGILIGLDTVSVAGCNGKMIKNLEPCPMAELEAAFCPYMIEMEVPQSPRRIRYYPTNA